MNDTAKNKPPTAAVHNAQGLPVNTFMNHVAMTPKVPGEPIYEAPSTSSMSMYAPMNQDARIITLMNNVQGLANDISSLKQERRNLGGKRYKHSRYDDSEAFA